MSDEAQELEDYKKVKKEQAKKPKKEVDFLSEDDAAAKLPKKAGADKPKAAAPPAPEKASVFGKKLSAVERKAAAVAAGNKPPPPPPPPAALEEVLESDPDLQSGTKPVTAVGDDEQNRIDDAATSLLLQDEPQPDVKEDGMSPLAAAAYTGEEDPPPPRQEAAPDGGGGGGFFGVVGTIGGVLLSPVTLVASALVPDQFLDTDRLCDIYRGGELLEQLWAVVGEERDLQTLGFLMLRALNMFEEFQCNADAAMYMRRRLVMLVRFFGHPSLGLVRYARTNEMTFKKHPQIRELEEILGLAVFNLSKYTSEKDFMLFLLHGKELERVLDTFDKNLNTTLRSLMTAFSFLDTPLALPPSYPSYPVSCDIRQQADIIAIAAAEGIIPEILKKKNLTEEQAALFKDEMYEINAYCDSMKQTTDSAIAYSACSILHVHKLRNFWLKYVHVEGTLGGGGRPIKLSILCDRLATALRIESEEYEAVEGEDPEAVQRELLTKFREALSQPGVLDPVFQEQDRYFIDVIEMHKLTRCMPADTEMLFNVIEIITNNVEKKLLRNCPPLRVNEQMVVNPATWSMIDEINLKNLDTNLQITQPGFMNVTGPRGSGKTTRIISVINRLPRSYECIYVDLTNCRSESDALNRIVSQLYIRKLADKAAFELAFRRVLDRSRKGKAIFVFDNLDVQFVPVPGAAASPRQLLDDSLKTFLVEKVLRVCADFAERATFIFVGNALLSQEGLPPTPAASSSSAAAAAAAANATLTFALNQMRVLDFPELGAENSLKLGSSLLPGLPKTLAVAGRNLPSEMTYAVRAYPLGMLRQIAMAQGKMGADAGKVGVDGSDRIVKDMDAKRRALLSADESMLISRLIDTPPFPLSQAWALCRIPFRNDSLRFSCAWDGLLRFGWVTSLTNGYDTSFVLTTPPTGELPPQPAWDCYLEHWADRLAQMHVDAGGLGEIGVESDRILTMDLFSYYYPHYMTLLRSLRPKFLEDEAAVVVSQPVKRSMFSRAPAAPAVVEKAAGPFAQLAAAGIARAHTNPDKLVARLAGKVERLLTARFTVAQGLDIVQAMYTAYIKGADPIPQDMIRESAYMSVACDLALFKFKNNAHDQGIALLRQSAVVFGAAQSPMIVGSPGAQITGRAFFVLGTLFEGKKRLKDARLFYDKAMEMWGPESVPTVYCVEREAIGKILARPGFPKSTLASGNTTSVSANAAPAAPAATEASTAVADVVDTISMGDGGDVAAAEGGGGGENGGDLAAVEAVAGPAAGEGEKEAPPKKKCVIM